VLSPCPPSFGPSDPPDCDVLFSPISNLSCNAHEDQVLDVVGVENPTYNIIFDEHVCEYKYEQEFAMKDDFLPPTPLLHYLVIFHDFVIPIESCEKSIFVDVNTFNHSQNT